ncbi:MAG: hypothetical protein KBS72_06715 [Bacteroidales bacterium]|nr:hypothetical protein [Candidatus Cacconaster scatequi]
MKHEINNIGKRERQAYVPASVKVIEVTAQRVLCESTNQYNTNPAEMGEQDVF